jgi:phosphate/sulfate permease
VENWTHFGAWILSMELAILMMQHNTFIGVPLRKHKTNETIRKVLINAVGFEVMR